MNLCIFLLEKCTLWLFMCLINDFVYDFVIIYEILMHFCIYVWIYYLKIYYKILKENVLLLHNLCVFWWICDFLLKSKGMTGWENNRPSGSGGGSRGGSISIRLS